MLYNIMMTHVCLFRLPWAGGTALTGTPNLSPSMRAIPNLEFYAPWFREPIVPGISYHDYRQLSDRAQQLARLCVADSSQVLKTGPTLRAP